MLLTRDDRGVISLDRADVEACRGERLGELGASDRAPCRRQNVVESDSKILLGKIGNQNARFAEKLDQIAPADEEGHRGV